MKLIRKRDIFTSFDAYLDGEMTIGECIDECETLDLSDLIIEIENTKEIIEKQEWGYRQESLERLERVIAELKEWGWSSDRLAGDRG